MLYLLYLMEYIRVSRRPPGRLSRRWGDLAGQRPPGDRTRGTWFLWAHTAGLSAIRSIHFLQTQFRQGIEVKCDRFAITNYKWFPHDQHPDIANKNIMFNCLYVFIN